MINDAAVRLTAVDAEHHAAAQGGDVYRNVVPENHGRRLDLPLEDRRKVIVAAKAAVAHELQEVKSLAVRKQMSFIIAVLHRSASSGCVSEH